MKTRIDFFKDKRFVMAELGVYRGEFSRELLSYLPGWLYLVDVWRLEVTTSADKDGKNNTVENDMFGVYMGLLDEFEAYPVTVVRGNSWDFLDRMPEDSLDCVYIDSDHSYAQVIGELRRSVRVVKRGGWITGHDYVDLAPGVIRAVDEFLLRTGYKIEYMSEDGCPSYYIINDKDIRH